MNYESVPARKGGSSDSLNANKKFAKIFIANFSLVVYPASHHPCLGDAIRVSPEVVDQCFAERLSGASGTAYLDHYATRLEIALDEHEHAMAVGILQIVCRRARGVTFGELEDLRRRDERTFASVLRDLESDGYLRQEDERLEFRSNLLREWWRKHYGRQTAR